MTGHQFPRYSWGSSWWPRERKDAVCWIVGWSLVAPLAQVRFLDLYYQTYLYRIFHRKPVALVGHSITAPAILFFLTLWLSTVRLGWGLSLGDFFAAGMVAFYAVICYANRTWSLFSLMAAAMVTFRVISELLVVWFAGRGLWALALVVVASLAQALSHINEDSLPPFVGGRADAWTPYMDYWNESPWMWLAVHVYTLLTLPVWTALEFASTPRVFAVQGLLALVGAGLYRDFATDMEELVQNAYQMGNKAPLELPENGGLEAVLSSAEEL